MLLALSIIAGACIAVQAGINSQLAVALKSPLLATFVVFIVSAVISLATVILFFQTIPDKDILKNVPFHLWFGGVLSALGVGLFYYLIPKMGVGSMMSLALTGQLTIAIIASHFGWFDLPITPLSINKIIGLLAMVFGIIIINR